jgi:hypothetical protein
MKIWYSTAGCAESEVHTSLETQNMDVNSNWLFFFQTPCQKITRGLILTDSMQMWIL